MTRLAIIALCTVACGGQTPPASESPQAGQPVSAADAGAKAPEAPPRPTVFPADWVGRWHGNVHAQSRSQKRVFGMILEIAPLENDEHRYTFRITYALDDGANVRDYELVTIDEAAGLYQVDEKNGIVIDARYVDGTLYTLFDVGGAVVDIRYTMTDDGIRFDVTSSTPAKATSTGGDGSEVKNIPFGGIQKALLIPLPAGS